MVEFNLEELDALIAKSKTAEEAIKFLKDQASKATDEKGLKSIIESAEKIASKFNMSSVQVAGLKSELAGLANAALKASLGFRELFEANESFRNIKKGFTESFTAFESKIKDSGNSMQTFFAKMAIGVGAAQGFIKVPDHFADMGKAAEGSRAQLSKLTEEKYNFMKAAFGENIANSIKNMAEFYDATANLERGLVMTAAKTGNLGTLYDVVGEDLAGLTSVTEDYNTVVTQTAAATGMTSQQVAQYMNELMGMPGMMKSVAEQTDIAGQQMHVLEAAITFAAGTGQELKVVMDDLSFAANTLGLTGEDSLQFLDRMSALAESTGLPLEKVRSNVKDLAQQFAMLTNNTDGTVNIFGQLAPALARANVAPDQMIAITRQVTEGINNMTTAQKAFLSASTGGPGGLQGAFQIEQMLAEGKQDEVFAKVRENFQNRIGGPIVTREDATQSPELAAQYQKQLMFMTSPAMGGMAKDERMAEHMLKALQSGDVGGMSEALQLGTTEDGKDERLNQTFERGNRLQERGNTILNQIARQLEYLEGGAGQVIQGAINETIGGESQINQNTMAASRERASMIANQSIITAPADKDFGEKINDTIDDFKVDPIKAFADMFAVDFASLAPDAKPPPAGGTINDEVNERLARQRRDVNQVVVASQAPFNPGQRVARELARNEERNQRGGVDQKPSSQQVHLDVSLAAHCQKCTQEIASSVAEAKIEARESANRRGTVIPGTR